METFKFRFEKYLDEKVQIALHTDKMKKLYSNIIDETMNGTELDDICLDELKRLQRQYDESLFEALAGQSDFIPDVPVWEAKIMLKEGAELMLGLNEYKPLPKSFPLARDIYRKISC